MIHDLFKKCSEMKFCRKCVHTVCLYDIFLLYLSKLSIRYRLGRGSSRGSKLIIIYGLISVIWDVDLLSHYAGDILGHHWCSQSQPELIYWIVSDLCSYGVTVCIIK